MSLFERVLRRLLVSQSSSCATLTRRALLIKCSKKLYFSKEHRGAYCSLIPMILIKCDRILCFSKERRGA